MESLIDILIIGDSDVGKTVLARTYVDNYFTADQTASTAIDFLIARQSIDGEKYKFRIWDIPDFTRHYSNFSLSNPYYKKTDVVLLVFSVSDIESYQNVVTKWIPKLKKDFEPFLSYLWETKPTSERSTIKPSPLRWANSLRAILTP